MQHGDEEEKKILTVLSMNSRASLKFIGNQIELSKHPTFRKVKKIEAKYKIKHLAEIDTKQLGFFRFLILVRFTGKAPSSSDIEAAAKKEPRIQLCLALNGGEFNLLFYVLAENDEIISKIRLNLIRDPKLIEYPAEWYVSPFDETYNFVPLRDEFIDVLKERIMKRSEISKAQELAGKRSQILMREFAVLKEINKDANIELSAIDKKYGFDKGRSQYSYYKLLEEGLLKRTTISMQGLPIKYVGLFIGKIINYKEFEKKRPQLLHYIIDDASTPNNKFALTGDITTPFSAMLFMPSIRNGDLEEMGEKLRELPGIEFTTLIITKIILGSFCYRNFDNAYSLQKEVLISRYGEKRSKKTEYSEKHLEKKEFIIELPKA